MASSGAEDLGVGVGNGATTADGAVRSAPNARATAAGEGAHASGACPNCGTALVGEFCHGCGEKRPEARDLSVRHFLSDAAAELTSLDSKLYHTLRSLLFRPGLLTTEWVAGRRTRYLKPLNLVLALFAVQLFVYTATKRVSMFNVGMIVDNQRQMARQLNLPSRNLYDEIFADASARKGESVEALYEAVNEKWQRNVSLLQPLQIAVLAVLLQLLYMFSRRYFVEHVVFAMHFLAFTSLTTTLMWPVYFFVGIAPTRYNVFVAVFKFLLDIAYMFLALRAVYRGSHAFAVLRAFVLFFGYFGAYLFVFLVGLFAAMVTVLR